MSASLPDVSILRIQPRPSVRAWSERHGFTPELVARWTTLLDGGQEFLASLLKPVPTYLRVNTLQTSETALARALEKRGFTTTSIQGLPEPYAVLRLDKQPFAVSATPEYLSGDAYLQDLASLTAALALEAEPGETVLDMAAAPGGKTTAISESMRQEGAILALEPVRHRAAALTANLRRLGLHHVGVRVAGGEEVEGRDRFDRILLDAPCTGEGVLPRDPKRRTGSLDEHAALAGLQRRLIGHAVRLLKPGGTLVYSTCTFAPEECELAVAYALGLGLEAEPLPFDDLNGVPLSPALTSFDGDPLPAGVAHARRVFPHVHATLGFFVVRLRKPADWRMPSEASVPEAAEPAKIVRAGAAFDADQDAAAPRIPGTRDRTGPHALVAELRDLDPPEQELFDVLLDTFGSRLRTELAKEWTFKVLGRADLKPQRRIVALKQEVLGPLMPHKPLFLGLPVATLGRRKARFTLEGGRLVLGLADRRVVRVKEKGEQLFLYGRNVLGKSVQGWSGTAAAGQEVLVADADGKRFLGIATAERELGGAGKVRDRRLFEVGLLLHKDDLGRYLRAQQEVPE